MSEMRSDIPQNVNNGIGIITIIISLKLLIN